MHSLTINTNILHIYITFINSDLIHWINVMYIFYKLIILLIIQHSSFINLVENFV